MTKTDEQELVRLLKQVEAGYLPYDIFVEIARLAVLPIIEFVPLRLNMAGEVEVLLMHRDENDPIWPGQFHTPGTVVRPTDTEGELYLAFKRIAEDELRGTEISQPYFVGSILHKSRRGTEQAQVFWVEVTDEPLVGTFYPVSSLPDNLIDSQNTFINQAAASFKSVKSDSEISQKLF